MAEAASTLRRSRLQCRETPPFSKRAPKGNPPHSHTFARPFESDVVKKKGAARARAARHAGAILARIANRRSPWRYEPISTRYRRVAPHRGLRRLTF